MSHFNLISYFEEKMYCWRKKALTWKQDPRQPAPARGPPSTRTPGIRFWHPKKDHMGGNLVMSNIFWVADDLCCFVEFQLCKIYDNKKKRMASLLTLVFSLHGLPTNREVDWDKFATAAIRNFQQRNPLLWTESKRAGIVNDLLSLFNAHYIIFWFSLYNILILFTNTWIDYAFKSTV